MPIVPGQVKWGRNWLNVRRPMPRSNECSASHPVKIQDVCLGTPVLQVLTVSQSLSVENLLQVRLQSKMVRWFHRVIIDGSLFVSESYAATVKGRDDSIVALPDGIKGTLIGCIAFVCECTNVCTCPTELLLLIRKFQCHDDLRCYDNFVQTNLASFFSRVEISAEIMAFNANSVVQKCIVLRCSNNTSFLMSLPTCDCD